MGGYREEPKSASGISVDDPEAVKKAIQQQLAGLDKLPSDTSATDATLAAHAAQRTLLAKKGRASTFLGGYVDGYVPEDPSLTPAWTQPDANKPTPKAPTDYWGGHDGQWTPKGLKPKKGG